MQALVRKTLAMKRYLNEHCEDDDDNRACYE